MSDCVKASVGFSYPLKMEGKGTKANEKNGIVSILGSAADTRPASLRRTLSADMSSKRWISQNGLMDSEKKNEREGGEESEARSAFETWASIQEDKKRKEEKDDKMDIWSSILSQKEQDVSMGKASLPPYVHPLVRRSKSSLSERSLEICTESLGSETGSQEFSSYPCSEMGESEEYLKEELQEQTKQEEEAVMAVKWNCLEDKKSSQRSFPPPIPSLARKDGGSTCMRSRRENGHLVLEAVETLSRNNFCVQRQDGRLVLTFSKGRQTEEEMEEEKEEDGFESSEEEEMGIVMKKASEFSSGHGSISVHRLVEMMNKPIGLANLNPKGSRNLNDISKPKGETEEEEEEEDEKIAMEKAKAKSRLGQWLPPRPRPSTTAATTSGMNVYEYYWRSKGVRMGPTKNEERRRRRKTKEQVKGGGGEELVLLNGCKVDPNNSLLFWEPYCIPTS